MITRYQCFTTPAGKFEVCDMHASADSRTMCECVYINDACVIRDSLNEFNSVKQPITAEDMMRAKGPTVVVFRTWQEGDVIALFPDNPERGGMCESYTHGGLNSGAYFDGVIDATKPATPHEYGSLERELEGLGYYLKVSSHA